MNTNLKCVSWMHSIGVEPGNYCCDDCHYKLHWDATIRHIESCNGSSYLVCCKVGAICLKDKK